MKIVVDISFKISIMRIVGWLVSLATIDKEKRGHYEQRIRFSRCCSFCSVLSFSNSSRIIIIQSLKE
nr:MAG TPA: hypothetical protein [Caudoviricetes sp.]